MKVCTVENCERAPISRGWCTLHYQRWRSNGDPLALQYRPSVDERFWGNVQRQEGGCWTWVGSITNSGYGVISVSNRRVLAHRWAYETLVRARSRKGYTSTTSVARGLASTRSI